MTTPGPFITPEDEYRAQSKSPRVIGQTRLAELQFHIDMTDEQMQEVCARARAIRDTYQKWEEFYKDIDLRKKRNMGFKAAVVALDLEQAAVAMGTTPEKIAGVMMAYSAAEDARIKELEVLWKTGVLPDRDVLGDPSEGIIDPEDPPPPPADPPTEEEPPADPPVEEPPAPPAEEPPADLTDPATP